MPKSTLFALFLAAALAGCQRTAPPKPSFAEDLAAITAFNAQYLGSINAGDIKTLSALTDDDHIIFIPNRVPVVGKAANDASNGSAFERLDFDESWTPEETVIDGDLGYQRGTFTTSSVPKAGGDKRVVSGAFLRIYRRQSDGQWRMTRDMFNSDGSQGN
ncbi:MAG: nuclear transport factor 2 family protein [Gammaproteobacteria bacterium]